MPHLLESYKHIVLSDKFDQESLEQNFGGWWMKLGCNENPECVAVKQTKTASYKSKHVDNIEKKH